jgi:hypothetical protein
VPRTAAVTLAAAVFAALAIVAAPLSAGPGPRNVVTAMAGVEETQAADTDSYGSTAIEVTATNQVCFRAIAKRAGTITAGHPPGLARCARTDRGHAVQRRAPDRPPDMQADERRAGE